MNDRKETGMCAPRSFKDYVDVYRGNGERDLKFAVDLRGMLMNVELASNGQDPPDERRLCCYVSVDACGDATEVTFRITSHPPPAKK